HYSRAGRPPASFRTCWMQVIAAASIHRTLGRFWATTSRKPPTACSLSGVYGHVRSPRSNGIELKRLLLVRLGCPRGMIDQNVFVAYLADVMHLASVVRSLASVISQRRPRTYISKSIRSGPKSLCFGNTFLPVARCSDVWINSHVWITAT